MSSEDIVAICEANLASGQLRRATGAPAEPHDGTLGKGNKYETLDWKPICVFSMISISPTISYPIITFAQTVLQAGSHWTP